MGAFLSAIGGAGNAAAQYGQQVRGLLEERRRNLVDLAMHMGDTEIDPNARSQYFQSAADLLSNKPMEKIVPPFLKQLQTSHQGNQALAQAIGGTPQQSPTPPPGPAAPGQTPGTGPSSSSTPSASVPPASLPANNPLQAGGQLPDLSALGQQPIPTLPPPGGPSASASVLTPPPSASISSASTPFVYRSPREILAAYESLPEFQTPAGRAFLAPALTQELSHNEALGQEVALRQMDLGERRQALAKLQSSPEWASIPDFMKSQYELWASSRQAPLPALSSALLTPQVSRVEAESMSPEQKVRNGLPPDAKGPYWIYVDKLTGQASRPAQPAAVAETTFSGPGGVFNAPKTPGAIMPPPGSPAGPVLPAGAAVPRPAGVDPSTGRIVEVSPQQIAQGAQPGVSPSILGTQSAESSVTSPSGVRTETHTTRKILPGAPGASAPAGVTPVPAAAGRPTVPASLPPASAVRPLDPTNELDHKVLALAQDAAAGAHLITNVADKDRVNKRMAELGLQPGMITGGMRDRAKNARLILGHLNDIQNIINQADKDGDLGVVATRWNDFLTNRLGQDPTRTKVFARLSSELGFLSTAVSMAHGGLRGGSSPTMVEHWEKALDAKDPATLRAKLGEAKKWMEGYAQLDNGITTGPNATGTLTPPPTAPSASPVDDLLKRHGY